MAWHYPFHIDVHPWMHAFYTITNLVVFFTALVIMIQSQGYGLYFGSETYGLAIFTGDDGNGYDNYDVDLTSQMCGNPDNPRLTLVGNVQTSHINVDIGKPFDATLFDMSSDVFPVCIKGIDKSSNEVFGACTAVKHARANNPTALKEVSQVRILLILLLSFSALFFFWQMYWFAMVMFTLGSRGAEKEKSDVDKASRKRRVLRALVAAVFDVNKVDSTKSAVQVGIHFFVHAACYMMAFSLSIALLVLLPAANDGTSSKFANEQFEQYHDGCFDSETPIVIKTVLSRMDSSDRTPMMELLLVSLIFYLIITTLSTAEFIMMRWNNIKATLLGNVSEEQQAQIDNSGTGVEAVSRGVDNTPYTVFNRGKRIVNMKF